MKKCFLSLILGFSFMGVTYATTYADDTPVPGIEENLQIVNTLPENAINLPIEAIKHLENNGSIILDLVEVNENGIQPFGTFYGTAGTLKLNGMSSGAFSWSISLNETAVASFLGTLTIQGNQSSNGGYFRTFPLSGSAGVSGSSPKGSVKASITGSAVGTNGKTYSTVPNSVVHYVY